MRKLSVLIAISLIFFAGCSKEGRESLPHDLTVSDCAAALKETICFADTLTAIDEQLALTIYGLEAEDVAAQQVYVRTGATAEEIAGLFEAADRRAAQKIKDAVLQRIAGQKNLYQDYLPAELPKLADPFLLATDKFVILCISDTWLTTKDFLDSLAK